MSESGWTIDEWWDGSVPPKTWCRKCLRKNPDLAHAVYEHVATLLAAQLRHALDAHLDAHGCGTGDHLDPRYVGGFLHCSAARELFELLPYGDRYLSAQ